MNEAMKRAAAERAAAEIHDGMTVGLGSGTTAAFAVEALARRVAARLQDRLHPDIGAHRRARPPARPDARRFCRASPPSISTSTAPMRWCAHDLVLVKGGGGSLLREKIVACASRRMIVAVDETKLVDRLGPGTIVPVEIEPFGAEVTLERLSGIGCRAAPAPGKRAPVRHRWRTSHRRLRVRGASRIRLPSRRASTPSSG